MKLANPFSEVQVPVDFHEDLIAPILSFTLDPFDLLNNLADFGEKISARLITNKLWKPHFERYFPGKTKGDTETYKESFVRESRDLLTRMGSDVSVTQTASDALKANENFMLVVVGKNGLALQYASVDLQAHLKMVLAAVNQNGLALQYASAAMQNNPMVVKPAVAQNGLALEYASIKMKNHAEVVLVAVAENFAAIYFASEAFRYNIKLRLAVFLLSPGSTSRKVHKETLGNFYFDCVAGLGLVAGALLCLASLNIGYFILAFSVGMLLSNKYAHSAVGFFANSWFRTQEVDKVQAAPLAI